jgi:flagellar biosynthesis chaperone FliJ
MGTVRPFYLVAGIVLFTGLAGMFWLFDSQPLKPTSHNADTVISSDEMTGDGQPWQFQHMRDDINRLRADVAHLQHQLKDWNKLAKQVKLLTAQLTERDAAPMGAMDEVAQAQEAAQQEELASDPITIAEQTQKTLTHLDDVFAAEPVDQSWAQDTSYRIEEIIAGEKLQELVEVYSQECRSSLCRVVVEHDKPEKLREFMSAFNFSIADTLPAATSVREDLDDGWSRITMYMAREGVDPPAPTTE